jgi:hypothetical protein
VHIPGQPVNKGVNEADRVFWPDVIIQRFWQEQRLGSVGASEVRHNPDSDASDSDSESVSN